MDFFAVFQNLFGEAPPLLNAAAERLNEALIAFAALGLGRRLRAVGKQRGRGAPGADKQTERLQRDRLVSLQPLDLPRQPIEAARIGRLAPVAS